MNRSRAAAILFLLLVCGCAKTPNPGENTHGVYKPPDLSTVASVSVNKTSYAPGEQIDLSLDSNGLDVSAWLGVVPSEVEHGSEVVNDQHDLDRISITERPLYLVAPDRPGSYDVRLHDSDMDGRELDSVAFEVLAEPITETGLEVEKKVYQPEELVNFTFTASSEDTQTDAWIGLVPSGIPHGYEALNEKHQHGVVHLLGRRKGSSHLEAPKFPGRYDLRFQASETGGRELLYVTFEVIPKQSSGPSPNP